MDNPTVMLAAEYTPAPKDHLHIFRELYEESFYFDDLLPIAKAWAQELNIRKFYCDPREPEFIKRMRRQRLWAVAAPEELGLARNLLGSGWVTTSKASRAGSPFPESVRRRFPIYEYRMPERDPRRHSGTNPWTWTITGSAPCIS